MTNIPKGYKQTEVGLIPEDWDVKKLGDCLNSTPKYGMNATAVPYSDTLPTYVRITDITESGRIDKNKKVSVNNLFSDNYYLSLEDIVVARTGASVGKSYLYNPNDGKLVFAGFLIKLSPNNTKLTSKFLKSIMETAYFWNWVKVMSTRSGQPGINGNEYAGLPIPLPTLPEQTAIAEALSDTDELLTTLEKLIEKKKLIKKGTMQELLTGKKRLPGFEKKRGYRQTEVGLIPEDWEVKKLEKVISFFNGDAHENFIKDNGKYVVVNSKFISSDGTVAKYSDKNLCSANIDDIVMVMSDVPNGKAIAKCFYINLNNKYTINQRVCILRAEGIFPRFLYLTANRNKYFLGFDDGVKQTNLRKQDILDCPIPLPPLPEQIAIAETLSDMDSEIEMLEKKLEKTKQIKQGMMQELLTGKTRLV